MESQKVQVVFTSGVKKGRKNTVGNPPKSTPKNAPEWYVTSTTNIADQGFIADAKTGRSVAVVYDKNDAPLLAAAPALREACIHAMVNMELAGDMNSSAWRECYAAVAQAEGF